MGIHKPVTPSRVIGRVHWPVVGSQNAGGGAAPAGAFLILETGDYLLMESSKVVLSETGITAQPIVDGDDDGDYDDGGGFDNSANDIDLGNDAGTAKKGYFYFAETGIPQGSEIVTAYLRVTSADDLADATVNLKFVGSDEDVAAVPANKPDAASRPRTTAVTYWNDVGAWVVDVQYDSPSIKGIVQEIVGRDGFAGPILIFVEDNGSTVAKKRKVKSYNGNPADAAQLYVSYWAPGAVSLDAPTGLAAAVGGEHKVTLTWTDNATGEDGYEVWRSLDNVTYHYYALAGANAETITVGGCTNDTLWYFKVRAVDDIGNSSQFSNVASITVPTVSVSNIAITTLVTGNVGGGDWHGRASMVENANGDWVMVWRTGTDHILASDGQFHIKFSSDGGENWTATDTKIGGGAVTGFPMYPAGAAPGDAYDPGEPLLYRADNDDLLLQMWKIDKSTDNLGTWQSVSSDDGEIWGAAAQIDFVGIATDDETWSTMDYFLYSGTLYAWAEKASSGDPARTTLYFIKSDDDGTSWDLVATIVTDTRAFEPGGEYLGNNEIIAIMRDINFVDGVAIGATFKTTSSDMGATWSALEDIHLPRASYVGRPRIYTDAHLKGEANWWTDTTLIMVGFEQQTLGSSSDRKNCIWVSRDAGATWTEPLYLDAQYSDGGYGDIMYDAATGKYVVVTYRGTNAAADLVQYKFDIDNLP